jgi:hypothetical protein
MPVDPKIINIELQAISGTLKLASAALVKVQGQEPPGPPQDPVAQQLLTDIAQSAGDIQALAFKIQKEGGTAQ